MVCNCKLSSSSSGGSSSSSSRQSGGTGQQLLLDPSSQQSSAVAAAYPPAQLLGSRGLTDCCHRLNACCQHLVDDVVVEGNTPGVDGAACLAARDDARPRQGEPVAATAAATAAAASSQEPGVGCGTHASRPLAAYSMSRLLPSNCGLTLYLCAPTHVFALMFPC